MSKVKRNLNALLVQQLKLADMAKLLFLPYLLYQRDYSSPGGY